MLCGTDLWDVARYVSTGTVVLCQSCVDVLKQAMDTAEADGEAEVTLPPRVHGKAPDDEAAEAVAKAFDLPVGRVGELSDYLEDADELADLIRQGASRHPMAQTNVSVEAIRFRTPDVAEVRFQILLGGGPAGFRFQGTAALQGGKWRVTRESLADVLTRAGVTVPPRRS